jgi:hypothetical protein
MIRFLMKKLFYYAGHLLAYSFTLFMIATSVFRGSRPLYGGIFAVEEYDQGVYFPIWMAA